MYCYSCGGSDFIQSKVLQDELIADWDLNPVEVNYINRQQGFNCANCRINLRANALAKALIEELGSTDTLRKTAISSKFSNLKILEINRCHELTNSLKKFPNHTLIEYPNYDIHNLDLKEAQ